MGHRALGEADLALVGYVVFIGLGLLNCFFGYRLFRLLLGIWGFVGGAALALTLLQGAKVDPLVQIVGAALGGIVGAVLVSMLYMLGVFLFGAGFGLLLAPVIQQHAHVLPGWPLIIVLAVVGGIAALALQRPLITLFTAFGGAWIAVSGAVAAVAGCPLQTFPAHCVRAAPWAIGILVVWLVLGFFGIATQLQLKGGGPRRRDDDD
jgi:hypothetical protein